MKSAITTARIIVGLLFIFSGLVKANYPHGLSYKMQEFFEVWTDDLSKGSFFMNHILTSIFHFLHNHSLALAVLMIAFEIIAGSALLFGWRIKLFSWFLLLLILFFTFLTGYTYITGKPTNCGCFGDCLPITSKISFLKDAALTVLIVFLFWNRNWIKPLFSGNVTTLSMFAVILLSLGFQWYTLNYLPIMDCLPFKKGNNISEKMKIPANAIPDSFAIRFVYEKGGKQFEFTPSELPNDLATYKFVSRADKLIRKGNAEPAIKGFALSGITDEDSTQIVLSQPYAILLFCENFSVLVSNWERSFSKLYASAMAKNIPAYIVTTQPGEASTALSKTSFAGIQIFKCDNTAVRTAARTNPCLYLLKQGTIVNKWSYKKMDAADKLLNNISVQPATNNQ